MIDRLLLAGVAGVLAHSVATAQVSVVTGYDATGAGFRFPSVSAPASNDAATSARFTLVNGERDRNGGDLAVLHDGQIPAGEDQPAANFFFQAGSEGGRIQVDLGKTISVRQINTFSWHAGWRAPQVYKLYAADGTAGGFKAGPSRPADPETCGWKLIATVDTRPKEGEAGGQYGVTVSDPAAGTIGAARYLLFDIQRTEDQDTFGQTFFSEIDVIDANGPALSSIPVPGGERVAKSFSAEGGKYQFTIDATLAPDLMDWADAQLRPVVQEWYPKLVAMLPSENYQAATNILLQFRTDMGGTPASAGGGRVNLNSGWFRKELNREARGSVVHELVHVVQSYGRARRTNPNATRTPGWLVEGLADYIRWFLYEPQTKGAEITARNLDRAKYDASYRVTGNFLNWVVLNHDRELVRKLNAAAREGRYTEQLWKDWTGKTVQELGEAWKKAQEIRIKEATRAPRPESED